MADYIAETIPILNSVVHAGVQLAAAMGAGALLDYGAEQIFALPSGKHIQNSRQALLESLELAAQVVVGGALTGALGNFLAALPAASGDPANGLIFGVVFFGVAQPLLQTRLSRVATYVRDTVLKPTNAAVAYFNGASRPNSTVGLPAGSSYQQQMKQHRRTGHMPPEVRAANSPGAINSVRGLDTGKY